MITFFKVLSRIYNHPFNKIDKVGGVLRFLKWQINNKLNPYPVVYQYTDNSKLIIKKGRTGATGNLYCGLLEFEDMAFLLHSLKPNDLFLDVGSNVGAFTMLAGAQIGAKVVAFEPIPNTYNLLLDNIAINNIRGNVTALNIGIGSKKGVLKFTKALDSVNHVATAEENNTIDVEVNPLDSINEVLNPFMIKIDVEGFETEVINGAENTLQNPALKVIIIELNGSGKRYGYDESKIHKKILRYGFLPYDYDPINKLLKEKATYGPHNTIYLRDINEIKKRLTSSKPVRIGNRITI